jgi:hypothetical protein
MLRAFSKRFVYVLIAALLLAQQGTVLHGLAHGVDALRSASQIASSQSRPDKRAPLGERHCDLCLTYAQVAAGAAPTQPTLAVAAPARIAPQTSHHPTSAPFARAYHSRAPPRLA